MARRLFGVGKRRGRLTCAGVLALSILTSSVATQSVARAADEGSSFAGLRSFVQSSEGQLLMAQMAHVVQDPAFKEYESSAPSPASASKSDAASTAVAQLEQSAGGSFSGAISDDEFQIVQEAHILQISPAYKSFVKYAVPAIQANPAFFDDAFTPAADCGALCLVDNGLSYVSTALSVAGAAFACTVGVAGTGGIDLPICLLAIGGVITSAGSTGISVYQAASGNTPVHTGLIATVTCTNPGYCTGSASVDIGQSINIYTIGDCLYYRGYSSTPYNLTTGGYAFCPPQVTVTDYGNLKYEVTYVNTSNDGYNSAAMLCYDDVSAGVTVQTSSGQYYVSTNSPLSFKPINPSCPQQHA
jgi:hypothetical protein